MGLQEFANAVADRFDALVLEAVEYSKKIKELEARIEELERKLSVLDTRVSSRFRRSRY